MTWDLTTLGVVGLLIAIIVVYDLWTLIKRGYLTTISWTIFSMSRTYPAIPFIFGFVAGHLFWNAVIDQGCP